MQERKKNGDLGMGKKGYTAIASKGEVVTLRRGKAG